jgi:hypothetical protein
MIENTCFSLPRCVSINDISRLRLIGIFVFKTIIFQLVLLDLFIIFVSALKISSNIPTQSRKTLQSFTFFSPKVASVKVQLI